MVVTLSSGCDGYHLNSTNMIELCAVPLPPFPHTHLQYTQHAVCPSQQGRRHQCTTRHYGSDTSNNTSKQQHSSKLPTVQIAVPVSCRVIETVSLP